MEWLEVQARLRRIGRAVVRSVWSREARADLWFEWRRRLAGEPSLPVPAPRSILVLCRGNLCRSPFAAHLLAGRLPGVRMSSAGLDAALGHPADPAAVRVASGFGVALDEHRTHPVDREEIARVDLILGFQGHHAAEVARQWPEVAARMRLLGDFLPAPPYRIEDPWGQPEAVFRSIYARIERAVDGLVQRLGEAPR